MILIDFLVCFVSVYHAICWCCNSFWKRDCSTGAGPSLAQLTQSPAARCITQTCRDTQRYHQWRFVSWTQTFLIIWWINDTGYITTSLDLAHEYMRIGKTRRATSIFSQALEVIRGGHISEEISALFLLRYAESLALIENIPKRCVWLYDTGLVSLTGILIVRRCIVKPWVSQKGSTMMRRAVARCRGCMPEYEDWRKLRWQLER